VKYYTPIYDEYEIAIKKYSVAINLNDKKTMVLISGGPGLEAGILAGLPKSNDLKREYPSFMNHYFQLFTAASISQSRFPIRIWMW